MVDSVGSESIDDVISTRSHDVILTTQIVKTENVSLNDCVDLNTRDSLLSPSSSTYAAALTAPRPSNEASTSSSSHSPRHRSSLTSSQWRLHAVEQNLLVYCKKVCGELMKSRFGSGAKGRSIRVDNQWMTPSEFEAHSGRSASKDWKRSIKFQGQTLQCLIEEGFLQVHAPSCGCTVCVEDERSTSPVRLYQQYKRRKKVKAKPAPNGPDGSVVGEEVARGSKRCITDAFSEENEVCGSTSPLNSISLGVPGLFMNDTVPQVCQDVAFERAFSKMTEILNGLEKGVATARTCLQSIKQICNVQTGRSPSNGEFLVVGGEEVASTGTAVVIDSPAPALSAAQSKKKCYNCNRDALLECSCCYCASYCSAFCQRKDWPEHKMQCGARVTTPTQQLDVVTSQVPRYILMIPE